MSLNNNLNTIRAKLIESNELWQHELLTSQKFLKFCNDRNLKIYDYKKIDALWALGFLRADLVLSEQRINLEGFEFVCKKQDQYFYLDNRKLRAREKGYGGSFSEIELIPEASPYFHPFKYYALYHVKRIFSQKIDLFQFFINPQGIINLSKLEIEHQEEFTSSERICELFDQWNRIAEAAIILEPYSFGSIHNSVRYSFSDTLESMEEKLNEYRSYIHNVIESDDRQIFEEYRQKLCCSAEDLDSNKTLHVLLRLTSWHQRNKIKDAIGGSMLLLTMAETMRRPLEAALNIKLPEEDEMGYGQWFNGARKLLYGSDRVLDAPKHEIKDFLMEAGLDFGVKVRCYLEGETEFGAINYALGDIIPIQLINLKGQFIESKGKGLAFRDSLENDLKAKNFSFVILDADRDDFVRVVQKAAKDDVLSGGFFLSSPDIEFENFSLDDLVEVVCILCAKQNVEIPDKTRIRKAKEKEKTGEEFFKALKRIDLNKSVTKGEAWGAALMEYAIKNKIDCQIVKAANLILHASTIKFQYSRDRFCVHPDTGEPVERNKKT